MGRALKTARLNTPNARAKLRPRPAPYWAELEADALALGYICRNGGGRWLARVYCGKGRYRRHKLGLADDLDLQPDGSAILAFKDAAALAREKLGASREGGAAAKRRKPLLVKEAVEGYVKALKAEKKSGSDAERRLDLHVIPTFGDREVASLTSDELREWRDGIAKAPARIKAKKGERFKEAPADEEAVRKRRANANRVWAYFRAALQRAYTEGHVTDNRAWDRVKPYRGVETARPHFLEAKECTRLVNACEGPFRQLVLAALYSGARYGELCRLKVEDFHMPTGKLAIYISKSGKSRFITLNDEGAAFFEDLVVGMAPDAPMLTNTSGEPWGNCHQIRPMKEAVERAGLSPKTTFHTLRHTYCSLAIMSGAELFTIAKNLGHQDTKMVERHYGHLSDDHIAKTIRAHAPSFGLDHGSNVKELRRG